MQIFAFPLPKTHKCRFQSAWLSLACVKALAGRMIVESGAFAWAWVVIFVTLACHVAGSLCSPHPPDMPSQRLFCRKAAVDQGAGWRKAFDLEEDLKVKLCRPCGSALYKCCFVIVKI
jgi:hypothetical protein